MADKRGIMVWNGTTQVEVPGDTTYGADVDVTRLPALAEGTNTLGATKDAHANWTTSLGVSNAAVAITGNSATAVTGVPTSGQKLVIDDIVVSTDTAQNISFTEETAGTLKFKLYLAANGSAQITTRAKCKLDTADKKLIATCSSSSHNTAITVLYHSEA